MLFNKIKAWLVNFWCDLVQEFFGGYRNERAEAAHISSELAEDRERDGLMNRLPTYRMPNNMPAHLADDLDRQVRAINSFHPAEWSGLTEEQQIAAIEATPPGNWSGWDHSHTELDIAPNDMDRGTVLGKSVKSHEVQWNRRATDKEPYEGVDRRKYTIYDEVMQNRPITGDHGLKITDEEIYAALGRLNHHKRGTTERPRLNLNEIIQQKIDDRMDEIVTDKLMGSCGLNPDDSKYVSDDSNLLTTGGYQPRERSETHSNPPSGGSGARKVTDGVFHEPKPDDTIYNAQTRMTYRADTKEIIHPGDVRESREGDVISIHPLTGQWINNTTGKGLTGPNPYYFNDDGYMFSIVPWQIEGYKDDAQAISKDVDTNDDTDS